ncbi:MAG: imidazole glycerol phosphate synthase subunit HisH [Myxococcaceae bacterium]
MKIAVIDYGAGNFHSIMKALQVEEARVTVESDARRALEADLLVLPGVGAFGPAAARLEPAREALREALLAGKPALGVCLGMQLLFDDSEEGEGGGLGVFRGRVTRLRAARTPHMGWSLLEGPLSLATAYFAHSFACRAEEDADVVAWAAHDGDRFPAVVRRGNVLGVQFHPEKSGEDGVAFLRSFVREVAR